MKANELEIVTYGLDDIVIENTKGNALEVVLLDENSYKHNILFKKEKDVLQVAFELNLPSIEGEVFRKYITKRLERARAVIKVPKNKTISIHGKTIGVTSKSYKGDLRVYIERGNVKLNKVLGNTKINLFQGNIFGATALNTDLSITTTNGRILINNKEKVSPFNQKTVAEAKKLTVKSIHANITLETKK